MMHQVEFEKVKSYAGKISVFGITLAGLFFAKYLDERKEDLVFLDNNKKYHNTVIMDGIMCINPLHAAKDSLVVIAVQSQENIEEISEQLIALGVKNFVGLDFQKIQLYQETMDIKPLIECKWLHNRHYELDWSDPKTLNEKLQWIKVNDRREEYILYADKYRVREYIREKFGEKYLIPLLFVTENYKDICNEKIPNEHCAIKSNCWSGDVEIIRSKENVDWDELQERFRKILHSDYSQTAGEWWYKYIKPCIVVEKLLEDAKGHIPNDYKFHFINGELQFIYCSVDREGENYRKIYDTEWRQLPFSWNGTSTPPDLDRKDIDRPKNYDDMLRMGKEIAKELPYVRVDYYELEGALYFGEITISHGAGFDHFIPPEYDLEYGKKLKLQQELIQ